MSLDIKQINDCMDEAWLTQPKTNANSRKKDMLVKQIDKQLRESFNRCLADALYSTGDNDS